MPTLSFRSRMPVPPEELYAWHLRPGAFARLNPPWDPARIVRAEPVAEGSATVLELAFGPLRLPWVARHRDVVPGQGFTDYLVGGPFRRWEHEHRCEAAPEGSTLEDRLTIELPLGALVRPLEPVLVTDRLRRMFRYRHRITHDDLAAHARHAALPRLRFARVGGEPWLAEQLEAYLTTAGHTLAQQTEPVDAVVLLAPTDRLPTRPPATLVVVVPPGAPVPVPLPPATRTVVLHPGHLVDPRALTLRHPDRLPAGPLPWLAVDDLLAAVEAALLEPRQEGPQQLSAPRPTTAAELRRLLRTPVVPPEVGSTTLRWPELGPAIAHVLGRG